VPLQVAEFLDDEQLSATACDIARRLTFAWASLGDSEAHSSCTAAINELSDALQHRVLALIPLHIVLKHASVEPQKIALQATVLQQTGTGVARLDSGECWAADSEVIFGVVSKASALAVSMRPVSGREGGSDEPRWRLEWMQKICSVLLS
jgi:hypothetical protein